MGWVVYRFVGKALNHGWTKSILIQHEDAGILRQKMVLSSSLKNRA